jgi:hypothetical protein
MGSSYSSNPWVPPRSNLPKSPLHRRHPRRRLITNDVQSEYLRLKSLGVTFRGEPTRMGPITAALFEDTCGNLINLVQPAV